MRRTFTSVQVGHHYLAVQLSTMLLETRLDR